MSASIHPSSTFACVDELRALADRLSQATLAGGAQPQIFVLAVKDERGALLVAGSSHISAGEALATMCEASTHIAQGML